jgi:cysteinyl-tRNA synthetase, unknown class
MTGFMMAVSLTRRFALQAFFFFSGMAFSRADGLRSLPAPRQRSLQALKRVVSWGCQYQDVNLSAIAGSDLDLIVIDPSLEDSSRRFVTQSECEGLKKKRDGARRIVLAYLCVGEADTKRWYWPEKWRQNVPAWIGPENPKWLGSRSVQYWNSHWRELVYEGDNSVLDVILDAGFDGVFLDRMDGYGDWGSDARALDSMADLVADVAVKARARDPGFIFMMQNAEALLLHQKLVAVIDAHNKESLLTGLSQANMRNKPEDVDWSLSYLRPLQEIGVPTFATEYVSDQGLRNEVQSRLTELGFVPFFATLGLNRLPGADDEARN